MIEPSQQQLPLVRKQLGCSSPYMGYEVRLTTRSIVIAVAATASFVLGHEL
jgi:hypothetical protein